MKGQVSKRNNFTEKTQTYSFRPESRGFGRYGDGDDVCILPDYALWSLGAWLLLQSPKPQTVFSTNSKTRPGLPHLALRPLTGELRHMGLGFVATCVAGDWPLCERIFSNGTSICPTAS